MTPEQAVAAVRELTGRSSRLGEAIIHHQPGTVVIQEGERNDKLLILLDGQVELFKQGHGKEAQLVDSFSTGGLLGLSSFWTRQPSFMEVRCTTAVTCLYLSRAIYDELVSNDPQFSSTMLELFIGNLVDRYRRMVGLNLKIASLTRLLEEEKKQLNEVINDLQKTRQRLVHQEKLATLGNLMAGIAHEINNPGASLARSVDWVQELMPKMFAPGGPLEKMQTEKELLLMGLESPFLASEERRARMVSLQNQYPRLARSVLRRLAALPQGGLELMHHALVRNKNWENLLIFFEWGLHLRTIKVSAERINRLVTSLRSYGKPDTGEGNYDLCQGLRDTIMVLNHKLKHYRLDLDCQKIPLISAHGSELNQVWTNLLMNACEATPEGREIKVSCEIKGNWVEVKVTDQGRGVAETMRKRIFELNYTTKSGGSGYGLGMGLSISRDIVLKHGGEIEVTNHSSGTGAVFIVRLPQTVL